MKFQPSIWNNTVWGTPDSLGCTENGAPHKLLQSANHKSCWRCGEWFEDQIPNGEDVMVAVSKGSRPDQVRFFRKPVEALLGKDFDWRVGK